MFHLYRIYFLKIFSVVRLEILKLRQSNTQESDWYSVKNHSCLGYGAIETFYFLNCNFCNHRQYSNQSQHKDIPTNSTTTPPCWFPPYTLPSHPPPLSIYVGGHHIFLTIIPIGKYTRTPPYTPLSLSTCRPTAVPSW